jgi:hypothetical protein
MNLRVPQNVGNLTTLTAISFWRSLYHEVSYFITYSEKTLTIIFLVPLGHSSIRSLTLFTLTQSDTVLVLQQMLVNDLLEMPMKTSLNTSQPLRIQSNWLWHIPCPKKHSINYSNFVDLLSLRLYLQPTSRIPCLVCSNIIPGKTIKETPVGEHEVYSLTVLTEAKQKSTVRNCSGFPFNVSFIRTV